MNYEYRIGEKRKNNQGLFMTIIEYRRYSDITVKFEDDYIKKSNYNLFLKGNIKNINYPDKRFINRTGEIFLNTLGKEMKIIGCRNNDDIDILFTKSGYIIYHTSYSNFKSGSLKDSLSPCVYGIGYFGNGNYKAQGKNKKNTTEYSRWNKMIARCYDKKTILQHPSYIGCSVCSEWHNFQNFADWYKKNIWTTEEYLQLDKDVLIKGNKIYSPNTCVLIPSKINSLFTKREKDRGIYPIGVFKHRENGTYIATSNNGNGSNINGSVYLGSFNTPLEAFNAYKQFKESYIKQVADDYANKYPNFPKRLYDAMYNYEVEITD